MHELLTMYLKDALERVGMAPTSTRVYWCHINGFLTWCGVHSGQAATIADFTADNIQTYDTSCKRGKLAQRTRSAKVSALKSFGRWLSDRDDLPQSELAKIEQLKVKVTEKARQRWASTEQVQALFAACEQVPTRHGDMMTYREHLCAAVFTCMAYGGMRRGEVCSLKCIDLDLAAAMPEIRVHGKGSKTRTVPLHPEAVKYLSRWIEHKPVNSLSLFAVPVYGSSKDPIVADLTISRLVGIMRELCGIAGIDWRPLSAHAFRRFAATKLLEVPGCTLRHVMEFLGHSDIATTIRYIGIESGQLRKLISQMNVQAPIQPVAATVLPLPKVPDRPQNRSYRKAAFRRA